MKQKITQFLIKIKKLMNDLAQGAHYAFRH